MGACKLLAFTAQKTMYGGKHIGKGDTVFIFACEKEAGHGRIACGVVTFRSDPRRRGGKRRA